MASAEEIDIKVAVQITWPVKHLSLGPELVPLLSNNPQC